MTKGLKSADPKDKEAGTSKPKAAKKKKAESDAENDGEASTSAPKKKVSELYRDTQAADSPVPSAEKEGKDRGRTSGGGREGEYNAIQVSQSQTD